jgi:hypothetical protein
MRSGLAFGVSIPLPFLEFCREDLDKSTIRHFLGIIRQVELSKYQSKTTSASASTSRNSGAWPTGCWIKIHLVCGSNDEAARQDLLPTA